jgi:hypothetical protein
MTKSAVGIRKSVNFVRISAQSYLHVWVSVYLRNITNVREDKSHTKYCHILGVCVTYKTGFWI